MAVAGRDTTADHARTAELWLTLLRAEGPGGEPAATIADASAFRAGFAEHPGRFEALAIEANAHAARAEKDSAVALYRLLKDGQPGNVNALAGFATFCAAQATALDEALTAAQQAVSLSHEKDATALDALADVYAARRQFDRAVDTAQRALDLNPGDGARRGRLETFEEQAVQALHAPSTGGAR
jgi:tetratricopeptide (TPR) repeat protein